MCTDLTPHPTGGDGYFRPKDTGTIGHLDATTAGAVCNHLPWILLGVLAAVPPGCSVSHKCDLFGDKHTVVTLDAKEHAREFPSGFPLPWFSESSDDKNY